MKKNIITISENTLRQIVAESLKNVVMEGNYSDLYRKENEPYHDDTTFMEPSSDEKTEYAKRQLWDAYSELNQFQNTSAMSSKEIQNLWRKAMNSIKILGDSCFGTGWEK